MSPLLSSELASRLREAETEWLQRSADRLRAALTRIDDRGRAEGRDTTQEVER